MNIPLLNDFERTFNDPVWTGIASMICRENRIPYAFLKRADQGENIVFLIDKDYILKIYTPLKNGYEREKTALKFAHNKTSLPVPRIVADGSIEGFEYLIVTSLEGQILARDEWLKLGRKSQIGLLQQLAEALRELHSHDAREIHFNWHEFIEIQVESVLDRQRTAGGNPEWLDSIPKFLDDNLSLLPAKHGDVFMHGDVHFGNTLISRVDGALQFTGLFDFADSLKGFREYEFVAIGVLMLKGQGELQREFFRAYGYRDDEIDLNLRRRLMLLTLLYECSSLKRYALRLRPDAINLSLEKLERAIWSFV
ncbi:MAG TPA: aminoglycoside phosphotransferase family protein [Pyrinomonadaceae bacterium]|nr:aminoglycoside phosphotransferase family protein [Pyrinomonadaceae bacterium]